MKHKVMIVDDQYVSRQMFELYLKNSDRYEVVFSIDSAMFADTYVLKDDIDLVIMDILMEDGSSGLDAAKSIKKIRPEIKIVAVTSMPEVSWLDKAREIGDATSYEFTDKEIEVLRILVTGASNAEISEELGVSVETVKTHIKHLLLKTGYSSRTKLAIQARLTGMVIEDK